MENLQDVVPEMPGAARDEVKLPFVIFNAATLREALLLDKIFSDQDDVVRFLGRAWHERSSVSQLRQNDRRRQLQL